MPTGDMWGPGAQVPDCVSLAAWRAGMTARSPSQNAWAAWRRYRAHRAWRVSWRTVVTALAVFGALTLALLALGAILPPAPPGARSCGAACATAPGVPLCRHLGGLCERAPGPLAERTGRPVPALPVTQGGMNGPIGSHTGSIQQTVEFHSIRGAGTLRYRRLCLSGI